MEMTEEFLLQIEQNYQSLADEQKAVFQEFLQSPAADVVATVLGVPPQFLTQGRQIAGVAPAPAQETAPAPAAPAGTGLMGAVQ